MNNIGTNRGPCLTYLVVDDHAGFRRALRSHLPGDTLKLVECGSGREAIEAFERHHPDWTLMDIQMPGMDGLAATRAIRGRFPEARIVILTQHVSPEYREEARAAGACAFVPKDELSRLRSILQPTAPQTGGNPPSINP